MRRSLPLLSILALSTWLSACTRTSPVVPPLAQDRHATTVGARTVPGRLVVRWKDVAAGRALLAKLGATAGAIEGLATDVVSLPPGISPEGFRAAAGNSLAYAEPDYVVRTMLTPNDPRFKEQYALKKVEAPAAWGLTRGSEQVKIAIVDTGIDANHPDLKRQIVGTFNAIGWRGKLGMSGAKDENGHGTHCAGVAAAVTNNAEGIAGMAPGCRLLIAKALGEDGSGAASDLARAIRWSVAEGASVISLSVGCPDDASALREAVKQAIDAGVVLVAAMGNEGKTLKNYPAAYPGVIAVGATTERDTSAAFSTRGSWISVAAPGANILSTTPTYKVFLNHPEAGGMDRRYGTLSGTSMATPLVAGLAALIKSRHPNWTPAQVKRAIEQTAVGSGRADSRIGHGRINAAAALRK